MNDSTTAVLRHTDRALTSATGSLLLVRLATGTRNLTATQCGLGSLASGCQLGNHYLVDQWDVGLDIEQCLWQVDGSSFLSLYIN